jgi:transcriptional regulator with XRE-family HTH domain
VKPLPNRREATLALYEALERGELSLAETCRRMRRILGLTQAAYAELVGISAQALMDFERGKSNPTLKTLDAIARPFGLEVGFRRKRHQP